MYAYFQFVHAASARRREARLRWWTVESRIADLVRCLADEDYLVSRYGDVIVRERLRVITVIRAAWSSGECQKGGKPYFSRARWIETVIRDLDAVFPIQKDV